MLRLHQPLLACCVVALAACSDPSSKPAASSAASSDASKAVHAAEEGGEDGEASAPEAEPRPDPHSFSRPDEVVVTHLGLSWVVDFDAKTLTGDALLALDRRDLDAPLLLDTRDLDIRHVQAAKLKLEPGEHGVPELADASVRSDPSFADTKWTLGEVDELLGQELRVELPEGVNVVKITYATRPVASGLQWLDPSQTAGKKQPFLYSQSQAIHARSWLPTQDSPGIRATFDAELVVDAPLSAVMAAEQLGEEAPAEGDGEAEGGDGEFRTFHFVMPQKVPAYLMALAVGDLERRELGPRTAVWADPTVVDEAAEEFGDMEAMMKSAEELYGEYAWGRYEVLVLPPAFPFGGMENPRLTFATPTLLAGDRSLVSVIAHELAHSWSGNLVTSRTWGDLWLNEGFTVYFERRIVEEIYGPERAAIEAVIGKRELIEELEDPGLLKGKPELQHLALDLRGLDPDEAISAIAYEKGALLLTALEQAYGREVFDAFLRKWFGEHAFGSVSTADFIDFASKELIAAHTPLPGKTAPDLAAWIDGAGLPPAAPEPEAEILDEVEAEAEAFAAGEQPAKEISTKGWTPWHWLHFLRSLPADIQAEQLGELDKAFSLTKSGNAEILGEWLELAARHRYEPAYERMEAFLIEVGRRKFLTPIYRALAESDEGLAQARAIYEKARPGYHSISRGTLDEILGN